MIVIMVSDVHIDESLSPRSAWFDLWEVLLKLKLRLWPLSHLVF